MSKPLSILFVGESVMTQHIEYKGNDQFSSISYVESAITMRQLFEKLGHSFLHIPCHLVSRDYPRELDQLKAYDVILFSDVGSNTFLLLPEMVKFGVRVVNLLKITKQYVADGGGFGMIGGYMTFQGIEGKAKWKDTVIEEILPVNMLPYDDRVEVPDGADLHPCSTHPVLEGLPEVWPYVLGYNRLHAKPDASVLVKYEDDPIICVGKYGKGRTLAYATDCTPHWAPAAMHNWPLYPKLWDNLVRWLSGR